MTGQVLQLKAGNPLKAIVPETLEDGYRLAQYIAKSGLAPHGMKTPEQILVAIMHGMEIGLPPMQAIQRIAVINGRPAIWGEAIPALLYAAGFKLEEKELIRANSVGEVNGYECTVVRPDGERVTRKFTEKDAKDAGLLSKKGPWQEYRKRMLQMRARGLAARDGAADVLSGLYLYEEAQDIEPVDITPQAEEVEQIGIDPHETDDNLVALLTHPCFEPGHAGSRPIVNHYKKELGGEEIWKEVSAAIAEAQSQDHLAHLVSVFDDEIREMPWSWASNLRRDIRTRWDDLAKAEETE